MGLRCEDPDDGSHAKFQFGTLCQKPATILGTGDALIAAEFAAKDIYLCIHQLKAGIATRVIRCRNKMQEDADPSEQGLLSSIAGTRLQTASVILNLRWGRLSRDLIVAAHGA